MLCIVSQIPCTSYMVVDYPLVLLNYRRYSDSCRTSSRPLPPHISIAPDMILFCRVLISLVSQEYPILMIGMWQSKNQQPMLVHLVYQFHLKIKHKLFSKCILFAENAKVLLCSHLKYRFTASLQPITQYSSLGPKYS